MLRPGDRLGDRYQVIEEIAVGGMGTLWRARHLTLDVDVALKVVSNPHATLGSLERFRREARAAAKLRSPHIVQMLDYGEFDGQPYLAMELLRGEDLATRLDRLGKLPREQCVQIMDGVAKAVELAHEAGIIHRDLKPANIFLALAGEDEIVKVLDFGVAKDLTVLAQPDSTTAVGIVGSPAYMSPEQVWGQTVGPPADVWAMSVVAFEVLTGKNPFYDQTLARVFERIVRDPVPKATELQPDLPPEMDRFFERALARAPNERFESAKELADELRRSLRSEASPKPAPPLEAPGSEVAVRYAPLWVGATLALTAGLVLFAFARELQKPPAERLIPSISSPRPLVSHATPAPLASSALVVASAPPPNRSPAAPVESQIRAPSSARATPPPKVARPSQPPASPVPKLDPRFGIPLDR